MELSAVLRSLQHAKAEYQSSRLCATSARHRKINARCCAARESKHGLMSQLELEQIQPKNTQERMMRV